MKSSFSRRFRRPSIAHEAINGKKENKQEQSFFGETFFEPFFKPVISVADASDSVHRKCADCEEKEKKMKRSPEKKEDDKKKIMKKEEKEDENDETVQRKEASAASPASSANYISSLHGNGNRISANANAFFSSRMGYDFSNVKIHTSKEASDSAKELNAKAYTVGNHIVFGDGQYNPESYEGRKLMAHELTHILQQNPDDQLSRKSLTDETEKEEITIPTFFEQGILEQNTRHFANCNGVSVEGHTDANYGNSFSAPGTSAPASDCSDCPGEDCVVNTGKVVSVFTTNPQVTLPPVPSGLNRCEQNAVQQFINTTLRAHEQRHVAAFNTYRGTVKTPYRYKGCASGLDAYLQQIHDGIETSRKSSSDAASAALDVGGANIFNISCNCPDPAPAAGD